MKMRNSTLPALFRSALSMAAQIAKAPGIPGPRKNKPEIKILFLASILLALAGCASFNAPWRKPIQPLTYQEVYGFAVSDNKNDQDETGQKRKSLIGSRYNHLPDYIKRMATSFRVKADASRDADSSREAATAFVESGMTLTNMLCSEYMLQATQKQQQRHYGRDLASNTNTAISAILNLTKSSNLATGVTSALFGGLDVNYQNWDAHYVASVDLPLAERLVRNAMARQAEDNARRAKASDFNYRQAESRLQQYASTCSFNGIKTLVNQSVTAGSKNVSVDDTGAANADNNDASNLRKGVGLQESAINAAKRCDLGAAALAFSMAKDAHPIYEKNKTLIDAMQDDSTNRSALAAALRSIGVELTDTCLGSKKP